MSPQVQPDHLYDQNFYRARASGSRKSAEVILPLLLARLPARSAVDVGCGTGTWLSVLSRANIDDLLGFDGDYVKPELLEISPEKFRAADLTAPLMLDRRFDLALCLEVGEHLPAESAENLVHSLTKLADVVLFSAAPPGQTGTNHINEQWPEYWARLFLARGFRHADFIRAQVWTNPEVDWWYAQNIIVYFNDAALAKNPSLLDGLQLSDSAPLPLVHPGSFEQLTAVHNSVLNHNWSFGVTWSLKSLVVSVRSLFNRRHVSR